MSHEFKPGDKVRSIATQTVKSIEPHRLGDIVHFESGDWGAVEAFELVEPSVTHRELREVLQELTKTTLQNDFNAGWNDALDAFFTQSTGEQP